MPSPFPRLQPTPPTLSTPHHHHFTTSHFLHRRGVFPQLGLWLDASAHNPPRDVIRNFLRTFFDFLDPCQLKMLKNKTFLPMPSSSTSPFFRRRRRRRRLLFVVVLVVVVLSLSSLLSSTLSTLLPFRRHCCRYCRRHRRHRRCNCSEIVPISLNCH